MDVSPRVKTTELSISRQGCVLDPCTVVMTIADRDGGLYRSINAANQKLQPCSSDPAAPTQVGRKHRLEQDRAPPSHITHLGHR